MSIFIILLICAVLIGLFLWWSDKSVMVTNHRLKLNRKSQGGQFRVVHLSDLQSNWFGKNQSNVTDKVKQLKPDLIVITGDIIDRRHTDYNAAEELLKGLIGNCPVCYVNGNHECLLDKKKLGEFYDRWKDGVHILLNENVDFELNGVKVRVAGLDEDVVQRARGYERGNKEVDSQLIWSYLGPIFDSCNGEEPGVTALEGKGVAVASYQGDETLEVNAQAMGTKAVSQKSKEPDCACYQCNGGNYSHDLCDDSYVNLLLSHEPQLVDLYKESKADVVFSGHAHGGQIRLPGFGGLYAPEQGILPKYKEGVYDLGTNSLVVSRGLGNSRFPFRVFNRPEIVCLDFEVEA